MPRPLEDSVVVITGASSGIGRAAAHAFARRGTRVVVAARRDYALQSLVDECERMGGRALAVPTDVADEAAVQALARRAVDHFDRIDVWINNAGVYVAGPFEDTPPHAFRRTFEVNVFGYVYGAQAALAQFRRQGGGVLINNASVDSRLAAPGFSAYASSKWAVLGLSRTLRQELRGSGIEVCTVLPAAIDTPIFQHAANYTGRALKALNPTYDAERVGEAMVSLAEHPRRHVTVGGAGKMLTLMGFIAPSLADRMMHRQLELDHYRDEPQSPTDGTLYQADPRWTGVSGGWAQTGELPLARIGAATLAALASAAVAWSRLRPRKRSPLATLLHR